MRWVALLRAVNLGARNKVPMAELRRLLTDAGYGSQASNPLMPTLGMFSATPCLSGPDVFQQTYLFYLVADNKRINQITQAITAPLSRPDAHAPEPHKNRASAYR